jgi:hypothetical protein
MYVIRPWVWMDAESKPTIEASEFNLTQAAACYHCIHESLFCPHIFVSLAIQRGCANTLLRAASRRKSRRSSSLVDPALYNPRGEIDAFLLCE